MNRVRVSAVSYANAYPFIYGLENSDLINNIDLSLDCPSVCATKLLSDKVDLGLIPISLIPRMDYYEIISDYCIGSTAEVRSVILVSNSELSEIKSIYLDSESRTSNELVKILAKKYWNINPVFIFPENEIISNIPDDSAALFIGDKSFIYENRFNNVIDLAKEWTDYTKLPFVFACWIANKKLPDSFKVMFSNALKSGVASINKIIEINYRNIKNIPSPEQYFVENIDYLLDASKKKAMDLFISYLI
ncbi:menaquinone biosynthetic enzyme MqnA/MqnD family protein [Bacteroidota bacterium]